ncbi:MAG TPA: hypothetical protein VNB64_08900 [Solirubrobacteraceae bacterium]|nr:hypothetical protein [Solirubrobacteraceae bacterium]
MSQSRVLVAAAIGAGVLYVVGFAALGSPPEATDSPREVADWFVEHRDGARIYAWSATFGTLAFAVFAALVREALPVVCGRVFLIGALAFIVETAVQAWFWAGLSLHPHSLDPETARTLLDVASFWGPLLTGATMVMIGAVTVLGLRAEPLIPRWLTVLGIVAFVEQAVETVTVFGTEGFAAPGGDWNILLGAGITSVFLIGLVVWAAGRLAPRPA